MRVAAAVARALPRRAGLVSTGAWAGGRGRGWRILRSAAGLCRAVQRGAGADGAILHRGCSAARTDGRFCRPAVGGGAGDPQPRRGGAKGC